MRSKGSFGIGARAPGSIVSLPVVRISLPKSRGGATNHLAMSGARTRLGGALRRSSSITVTGS